MLDEILLNYMQEARNVENLEKLSKEDVVDLYVKNKMDEGLANTYMAAVIVKYWYLVETMFRASNFGISPEDCYSIVIDGIMIALRLTPWLKEDNKLYHVKEGANKAISVCVETRKKAFYAYNSHSVRAANSVINARSLDALQERYGDFSYNVVEKNAIDNAVKFDNVKDMIEERIQRGNLFFAMVIDLICYDDCFPTKKQLHSRKKHPIGAFSRTRLVKSLRSLDDRYAELFSREYRCDRSAVHNAICNILLWKTPKLQTMIDRALADIKVSVVAREGE